MGNEPISPQKCGFFITILLLAFGLVILLVVMAVPKSQASSRHPSGKQQQQQHSQFLQDFSEAPSLDSDKLKSFYSDDLRVLVKFAGYIEPKGSHKYMNLNLIEVKHKQVDSFHLIDLHTELHKIFLSVNHTLSASNVNTLQVNHMQIFSREEPLTDKMELYCSLKPRIHFNATDHYCCHETKKYDCLVPEEDVRSHPDVHEVHYISRATLHVQVFELEIDGFIEGRQEPWVFAKPRHYCKPTLTKPNWFTGKMSDFPSR